MSAPIGREHPTGIQFNSEKLIVSEVFGPTFQGEGPSVGRRCSFLRLGACNLQCSFCDTPYTWDWAGKNGKRYDPEEELLQRSVQEIWDALVHHHTDMLVITGGEPMLQQRRLEPLLRLAHANAWRVEIETAGTVAPNEHIGDLVTQFNVSPKLANSGNHLHKRYRPDILNAFQATGRAAWKFVATTPQDLDEVEAIVQRHQLQPIYIMPEATDAEALTGRLRLLAEDVLARGWNVTTRLQIALYGNQRGV